MVWWRASLCLVLLSPLACYPDSDEFRRGVQPVDAPQFLGSWTTAEGTNYLDCDGFQTMVDRAPTKLTVTSAAAGTIALRMDGCTTTMSVEGNTATLIGEPTCPGMTPFSGTTTYQTGTFIVDGDTASLERTGIANVSSSPGGPVLTNCIFGEPLSAARDPR